MARRAWPALAVIVAAGRWPAGSVPTRPQVYRTAGGAVDGLSLHGAEDPVSGLPFTYPPFAAVVMVPLALLPRWPPRRAWTAASMAALAAVVVVALARAGSGPAGAGWSSSRRRRALALEPVWQNLTFGQVNLVLMAGRRRRPDPSRAPLSGCWSASRPA